MLATAYFAYDTSLMARIASVLGRTEDAAKYEALFDADQSGVQRGLMSPRTDASQGDTQTAYVLALRFGLLPDALRPLAAQHLVADIEAKGGHLSTGFVGVGYLCPVLTDAGYADVAYRLLLNETFPSWGYSIKQGATTIWERWDGWTEEKGFQDVGMNSFNHYSLGSVGEWLQRYVAGIDTDPDRPGFDRIRSAPAPQPPAGGRPRLVRLAAWPHRQRLGLGRRHLRWTVTVPANTEATVSVPTDDPASVREGSGPAAESEGLRFLESSGGAAGYSAVSGTYHFTAPLKG